jgi:predicted Zn-dependent protease
MSNPAEKPDPQSPPPKEGGHSLRKFMARDSREHLWALLDALDARPVLKRSLLIGLPALALAAGLGFWGYKHWARNNAIRIAQQWLDAGRLDRAGAAIQDALRNEPDLPASWRLASELAWREGNRTASVDYAKRAAEVGRYQADDVLAWAEAAILSDDTDQALEAESLLDPATAQTSPRALRLEGEVARRGRRFAEARDRFQAALRADTTAGEQSPAVDEVPLGIVSLQTGMAADRALGQSLLSKWAADPRWGVDALRALLADAVAHGERDAVVRWAEALRMNPRFTLGDMPACLQALADFDAGRYQAMLDQVEAGSRSSPNQSAQLLGWLTQIGRAEEAVRWGESLDPAAARKPPIAQGIAEALRATHRWADLQAWVNQGSWGRDIEFLQWAYGMQAARQLGDGAKADSLWQSLYADARLYPAHALFAGDALVAWGSPKEAADLLWQAAERTDLAYQALGSLARLYQIQHDAVGQYRAFARLNEMRPTDKGIANNLAYFAAITDLGSQTHIERIAEDNFNGDPDNVAYRSTYALVLVWSGQTSKAMSLLDPVSGQWRASPAVAFAYGATLASLGRKTEAKDVFDSLDPRNLGPLERDWIRAALR